MLRWMSPFLILALGLLLSGCLGPVQELYPDDESDRPYPVYLLRHGWHVGLAIESEHIRDKLPEHDRMPEATYLKFGWGDRRYYPHESPGIWRLLNAALLPSRSVIHVVGVDISIEHYFSGSDIIQVNVSPEGMENLADFLIDRFRRSSDDDVTWRADGLYSNSAFFDATGFYYVPKTSNVWTARALRRTGAPITPVYAVTAGNLIYQTRQFGEVIRMR
jgi:uncharacterized protein (TIGR02117 family)